MNYTIRPLCNGECVIAGHHALYQGDPEERYPFMLFLWLIEGGHKPMLVDTGPKDVEGFNRGTAKYIPGGVHQEPHERTPELLAQTGIDPADVSHVFITHLHADHYDYFDLFPNAQFVVNGRGFLESLLGIKQNVIQALARRWPNSLRLAEDEEILPGISTFWLGCHSISSQAIAVQTDRGAAVFTGDVVYKYRNIEDNIPIGWADPEECLKAMAKIRDVADIVIPSHDPELLKRFPSGIIGI